MNDLEKDFEILSEIERQDEASLTKRIHERDQDFLNFLRKFEELYNTEGWQILEKYIEKRADVNSLLNVPDEKLPIERARIKGMLEVIFLVRNYKKIYDILKKYYE